MFYKPTFFYIDLILILPKFNLLAAIFPNVNATYTSIKNQLQNILFVKEKDSNCLYNKYKFTNVCFSYKPSTKSDILF